MSSKETEAMAWMKSAKKRTTKGITKWSISNDDWNTAALEYEKAAKVFTHSENVPMAIEAWRAASEAHDKANNGFPAGKCLENLAQFLADAPKAPGEAAEEQRRLEITKCYIDAASLFALANKADRQAEALTKAANSCTKKSAPEAVKLMKQALDTLEDNEKWHHCLDLYRSLILTQVRGEMWAEAIQTLKRQNNCLRMLEQPGNAAKCGLEIVVLALYIGDWVLADREFKDASQNMYAFPHSKEQACAYDLISAVEDRDNDRLSEALKDQQLTFITAEISRMSRKIKAVGFGNAPPKKEKAPVAVGSPSGPSKKGPAPVPEPEPEDDEDVR
jgi:tetratricopeptide (TPR) repeat protein